MTILLIALTLLTSTPIRQAQTIVSGSETLEAELVIPDSHAVGMPAVVFLVGSGDGDFKDYVPGFTQTLIEDVFLPRDVAILYFNKRGVGLSSGNWKRGSFETRTSDAEAAVRFLRSLPNIDSTRIGLIGHSQGGWIAQMVAARDPSIAFVVSLAGPVVSVREQDLRSTEIFLECDGFESDALEKKVRKRHKAHDRMAFWGKFLPFGELGFMARILSYDPRETVAALSQPTFLAYAEFDAFVDAAQNKLRLEEIFPNKMPSNLSLHIASGVDHMFRETDTVCFDWEASLDAPYNSSFLVNLNSWLDDVFHE